MIRELGGETHKREDSSSTTRDWGLKVDEHLRAGRFEVGAASLAFSWNHFASPSRSFLFPSHSASCAHIAFAHSQKLVKPLTACLLLRAEDEEDLSPRLVSRFAR